VTTASISVIPAKEVAALGAAIDLIDVRMPGEFAAVHAQGARLVPLPEIDPKAVTASRKGRAGSPMYLICKSGKRAGMAAEKFAAAGVEVRVVEGGTDAWVAAGLPVVRGRGVISLERQVRIAAGLLVLAGVVLAIAVHPFWIGLSGFVGAGLVFAGVTDTCAMGMLIGKMPWNHGGTCGRA
jgi:rhodanese-related sulfurtransferase